MCHCGSDIRWPSAVTGWQFLWPACFSFRLAIICNHLELSHQVCQHRYYDREVFFISAAAAQSDLSPLSRIFDFCCCISLHCLDSTRLSGCYSLSFVMGNTCKFKGYLVALTSVLGFSSVSLGNVKSFGNIKMIPRCRGSSPCWAQPSCQSAISGNWSSCTASPLPTEAFPPLLNSQRWKLVFWLGPNTVTAYLKYESVSSNPSQGQ